MVYNKFCRQGDSVHSDTFTPASNDTASMRKPLTHGHSALFELVERFYVPSLFGVPV